MIRSQLRRMVPASAKQLWRRYSDSAFKWRYVDNWAPTLVHRLQPPDLAGERGRVAADLARDGIALTTVDRLCGDSDAFEQLVATVGHMESEQRDEISKARAAAVSSSSGHKSYQHTFLARHTSLPRTHGLLAFAQREPLRAVADAYFGMRTELRQVNVWYNFATPHGPSASQFWHRDREDRMILKVFVYLDDVTEDSGPLNFAPGTHRGQGPDPEAFKEPGHSNWRSTDEQMARVVVPSLWRKATAPRGTIVFADTSGYHKGGDVKLGERKVFVAMYTSTACREEMLVVTDDHVVT